MLTGPRAPQYGRPMSTGPQWIARFVTVRGVGGISSFEKNFRSHRAAGQVPTAKPGGGSNAVHLGSISGSYILLGLSASAPRLAAETASKLATLDWTEPQAGDVSGLLNVLAGEIEMRATRIYKGWLLSGFGVVDRLIRQSPPPGRQAGLCESIQNPGGSCGF